MFVKRHAPLRILSEEAMATLDRGLPHVAELGMRVSAARGVRVAARRGADSWRTKPGPLRPRLDLEQVAKAPACSPWQARTRANPRTSRTATWSFARSMAARFILRGPNVRSMQEGRLPRPHRAPGPVLPRLDSVAGGHLRSEDRPLAVPATSTWSRSADVPPISRTWARSLRPSTRSTDSAMGDNPLRGAEAIDRICPGSSILLSVTAPANLSALLYTTCMPLLHFSST